jgi:hypothetical protein
VRLVQQQTGVVLYRHDTTELDYSGLTALHGELGQIGNSHGHGYLCWNSLAVLPQGRPVLGLVSQILHVRPRVPKNETRTQRRDRESRESRLWLQAVTAVAQARHRHRQEREADASPLLEVDVADRASDTFEFLDHAEVLGRHYVVRSQHHRVVAVGHDAPPEARNTVLLHDHLRALAAQGPARESQLAEREGQPARKAQVRFSWAAVTWRWRGWEAIRIARATGRRAGWCCAVTWLAGLASDGAGSPRRPPTQAEQNGEPRRASREPTPAR